MKALHQLLLFVVTAFAPASGGGDCLLPVPDPRRLFSPTPGGTGQELARVAASEYKTCVTQCCEQTEGLCNVILFHKPASIADSAAEPNCVLYSCQPINSCSFTAEDKVQIYAASEAVLAIFSGTDASSNHPKKKYSEVEDTTVSPSSTVVSSTATTSVLTSTQNAAETEDVKKKTQTTTAMLMTPATSEPSKSDIVETETITSTTIPEAVTTNSAASSQIQSTISPEETPSSTAGTTPEQHVSSTKQETGVTSTVGKQTTIAPSSLTPGSMQTTSLQKTTQADRLEASATDGKLSPTGPVEKSTQSFQTQTPTSTQSVGTTTVSSEISTSTTSPELKETPQQTTGQKTTQAVSGTTTQMWTTRTITSLFQSSPSTQKSADTHLASNPSTHGTMAVTATKQLNLSYNGTSILTDGSSSPLNNTYGTGEHSSAIGSLSVASRTVLIGTLSVGCISFFAVLVIVGKRLVDGWKKRHYSRIDYLVDGMYSE